MGIRGPFGTYVIPWEATFSLNRVEVSVISFISLAVYRMSLIIALDWSDRYEPRRVLTLSMLFMGIGLSASFFLQTLGK